MAAQNRQAETPDSTALSEALPLLWDGASHGTVEAVREGLYLRFRVRLPARGEAAREGRAVPAQGEAAREELRRVWLCGEDGEARLGTLEPADGALSLDRRLSLRSLSPLGKLLHCEVRPASEDDGLSGEAGRSGLDILPGQEGGVRLAYPAGGPFPLPELFCFARLETVLGRECWVFSFDRDGRPAFR